MPMGKGYNMVQVPGGSPSMQYQAPQMRLGRSQFDLSHNHKTTFEVGVLVPYFLAEVIPGDTQTCKLNSFIRIFSPLNAPIMDNIEASIEFFFVPNRLVWEHWEEFLGSSVQAGAQSTDYTIPVIADGATYDDSVSSRRIARYMGIPFGTVSTGMNISALPFRAYNLIYNEWYRDQNLIDQAGLDLSDIADDVASFPLRKTAKKHDYFTSALPYVQKGDAPLIPLSGLAPIEGIGKVNTINNSANVNVLETGKASVTQYALAQKIDPAAVPDGDFYVDSELWDGSLTRPAIYADLARATEGITINALREAAAVQRLLERDARGGTRHPELIRAHFGVDVPDYRTQRPEYLGGGRGYINVTPVAQTSTEGGTENVGTLTGVGTGQLRASWAKSFVEHGWVMGILRARGDVSYQQGLDRMWTRQTRYDYLWPELAHLGEQAILNKEIFVSNVPATDDAVFGYQERYAEYRYKKSLVTGLFSSDAAGSLDYWHLAEDFASLPALNSTFIEDQTPMARVTAVPAQPDFIIDGRFDYKVARALPVRPVPTLGPARF